MPLSAQSASVQTAPAQSAAPQAPRPQWELDAGGKAEFDVASVKQDNAPLSPQTVHTNIPLGPMDAYSPTGGLLSATNIPMLQYLVFAYKLSNYQVQVLFPTLPKWANTDHYDIQARASGNPTKDQFRLMMQALLADRFKLAIHYETRQLPVLALVLDKPGKMGPSLVQHPDSVACSTALPPPNPTPGGPPATIDGKLPVGCGAVAVWLGTGRVHAGARNITLAVLATQLNGLGNALIARCSIKPDSTENLICPSSMRCRLTGHCRLELISSQMTALHRF